jgi:predicted Zn-dependent protease
MAASPRHPPEARYASPVSWNRREMLGGLGVASASTLLWALGCGAPHKPVTTPLQVSGEVRSWLRDAVSRLAAVYPSVHALAVTRRRTTAAIDVLGTGVARARRDGVVLTVRDAAGLWHEQVTADLTQRGIAAAVRVLVGTSAKRASIDFGPDPQVPGQPAPIDDNALKNRVGHINRNDHATSSRIVYAAALIDVDDVTVWSIAPGHDREQYFRRVRKRATRAAWNGTRPVVSEVERGWTGELDDQMLEIADVTGASTRALQLMTPGAFADGDHVVVLEPSIVATVVDAAVRGLFTSTAGRRPEVARRLALGATVASPLLTLVDDPTTAGAYGASTFDDEGEPAASITLLDAGRVAGRLGDRAAVAAKLSAASGRACRPGHVGDIAPAPTHLRLAPGTETAKQILGAAGWILEGTAGAVFDPSSDRIVIGAARARELKNGSETGRVYADVELVGDLATLLANVTAVASESGTTVIRDEVAGEPRWRSIAVPWLRTHGFVRARRRAT